MRSLLSVRLALAAAVSVLVAVGVFAVAANALIADRALDRVDRSLETTADAVVADLEGLDLDEPDFTGPATPGSAPRPRPATADLDPGTRVEIHPEGVPPPSPPRTVDLGGERFRLLVRRAPRGADGTPRTVSVARPVGDVEQALDEVAWVLGVTALVAAVIALVLALLIGRRALRPLVRARGAAERVAASQDPSLRIPEGRPDEVGRLVRAMNRMLARLEEAQTRLRESLAEQRRFAADASHELRTPLTALRGDVELVRSYPLPDEEREAVLDEIESAIDAMGRTVSGLLSLARSEGADADAAEAVDVEELLNSLVQPGEGPEVTDGASGAAAWGDPDLVRAILVNLLSNARRHGERVTCSLERDGDWVVAAVADDGPGIAPEDRERIFDRFYRAPPLRGTPGSGLGLPIARAAAESLGGSLRLRDRGPGATFEVRLPAASAAAREMDGRAGVPR